MIFFHFFRSVTRNNYLRYFPLIFVILSNSATFAKVAPSFDCNKNLVLAEQLVCNDDNLSAMDVKVYQLFNEAKSVVKDKKRFTNDVTSAIKARNNICTDAICLIDWYKTRENAYKDIISESTLFGRIKKTISKAFFAHNEYVLLLLLAVATSVLSLLTKSYKTLFLIIIPGIFTFNSSGASTLQIYFWLFLLSALLIAYLKQLRRQYLFREIENIATGVIRLYSEQLNQSKKFKITKDIYGIEDDSKWEKDKRKFIANRIYPELISYWKYKDIINEVDLDLLIEIETIDYDALTTNYDSNMTGRQYEFFIADELRSYGWDVFITPGSGDHGADLVASKNSLKVVIECKKWTTQAISNRAVQAVNGAKAMYQADYAAVVSNAEFTKGAKQLASSNNVILIHHDDLDELEFRVEDLH